MPFKTTSFEKLPQMAEAIGQWYRDAGIDIPSESELEKILNAGQQCLSGHRLTRYLGIRLLFKREDWTLSILGVELNCLYTALLLARKEPNNREILRKKYLPALAKEKFSSLLSDDQTQAKDLYYELFFLHLLTQAGYTVELKEEPDNVFYDNITKQPICIFCKHPYVVNKIEIPLRRAFDQVKIHAMSHPSIIAISFDQFFRHAGLIDFSSRIRMLQRQIEATANEYLRKRLCEIEPLGSQLQKEFPNVIAIAGTLRSALTVDKKTFSSLEWVLVLDLTSSDSAYRQVVTDLKTRLEQIG